MYKSTAKKIYYFNQRILKFYEEPERTERGIPVFMHELSVSVYNQQVSIFLIYLKLLDPIIAHCT